MLTNLFGSCISKGRLFPLVSFDTAWFRLLNLKYALTCAIKSVKVDNWEVYWSSSEFCFNSLFCNTVRAINFVPTYAGTTSTRPPICHTGLGRMLLLLCIFLLFSVLFAPLFYSNSDVHIFHQRKAFLCSQFDRTAQIRTWIWGWLQYYSQKGLAGIHKEKVELSHTREI